MHQNFSQYNLVTKLAEKYSHSTYLASPINPHKGDGEPERQVVLTLFPLSLCGSPRENLLLKAEGIKKLQHKHLAPILDIGVEEEHLFVVREYMPCGSLRNRLKRLSHRRLELRNALNLVLQVGEALIYAHKFQIFHGNLKPENIFFNADGQAVLTDFNLISEHNLFVRDHIADRYPLCYTAPEQFVGTCDAKSDQYALGCLAYELITGRPPFAIHSLDLMHKQRSNNGHVRLFETDTDLPLSLEVAVLKSLTQNPDGRFADFSWFIQIIKFISSSLLTSTSLHPDDTDEKILPSRPMDSKEPETVSSFIKNITPSQSPAPQIQYFSPIMQSSLGSISEMLISSFAPRVTITQPATSTSIMQSTLGKMPPRQTSPSIPSVTPSEPTTPLPPIQSSLDYTAIWHNSSFYPQVMLSEQQTPTPLAASHTPAFPFSEPSRERLRPQVSLRSSKVGRIEAYGLAQKQIEPNLPPKKSHFSHKASDYRVTPNHNARFFLNAIGLILFLSMILSLIIYVFWLRG